MKVKGVSRTYYSNFFQRYITTSWTTSRGPKTQRAKWSQDAFAAAVKQIRGVSPDEYQAAQAMAVNTPYLGRDLLMKAARGTLVIFQFQDGSVLMGTQYAATLLEALLNTISETPGTMIVKTVDGWSGLLPGDDGKVLTIDSVSGLPIWETPAGGGGTIAHVDGVDGVTASVVGDTATVGLASGADDTLLANISGGAAPPSLVSIQDFFDTIGGTDGWVFTRVSGHWVAAAPGVNVSSLTAHEGIDTDAASGAITIGLTHLADKRLLGNFSGGSAAPVATTVTVALDGIGNTDGDMLYRTAGAWTKLAHGSAGDLLQSNGSIPVWTAVGAGTGSFHPTYRAGNFYGSTGLIGTAASTLAGNTGTVWFTPFYVPFAVNFTKATCHTTSITAGATATMGLYSDAAGKPSAKLFDFGSKALSASSDNTITGLTTNLTAGWYWLAIGMSASCTFYGVGAAGASAFTQGQSAITGFPSGYSQAWSYSAGNLPAVGTLAEVTGTSPSVWLSF